MRETLRRLGRIYRIEVMLFSFALLARIGFWFFKGTNVANDWSGYQKTCSVWFTNPLGIVSAWKGPFYAGFTLPSCVITSIPGTTVDVWIAVQVTLSAIVPVLVYWTGRELVNETSGLVAGLCMVVLWDTFQWSIVTTSDALFTFAFAVVLWAVARHRATPSRRTHAVVLVSIMYLSLTRPYGFPLAIGWLVFEPYVSEEDALLPFDTSWWLPVIFGAASVAAVPRFIQRYSLVEVWSQGIVVSFSDTYVYKYPVQEADTWLGFVAANAPHLVVLGTYKAVMFFAPFVGRHSTIHIVVNAVTYVPITALGFLGAYDVVRRRQDLARYWVTPVVVLTLVSAVTFVSYGFRYRAPLGVSFALLSGFAVSSRLGGERLRSLGGRIRASAFLRNG